MSTYGYLDYPGERIVDSISQTKGTRGQGTGSKIERYKE